MSLVLISTLSTSSAEAPQLIENKSPAVPIVIDTSYIKERIAYYSDLYEVSEEVMNVVVACESSYNPNAVGDEGMSKGLVQIHMPSHPNITDDQAFEIEFALKFLAENLKEGRGELWTCWRKYNAS